MATKDIRQSDDMIIEADLFAEKDPLREEGDG